ncbi:MAG: M1 family metallopeptidase [Bacteroidetes bacterium]|nr:M1 family metallopeptidase [Bacteroidota bacterium]MBP6722219.1 M1 family metallopeptidase [Bacteroidia bacterium]
MNLKKYGLILGMLMAMVCAEAQVFNDMSKFKQLQQELPTPNAYRTASGAPGHEYYQQKADYAIEVEIDDDKQILRGVETITYWNNSPDPLTYLWLQLDQNLYSRESETKKIQTGTLADQMTFDDLAGMHHDYDGGFKLDWIKDTKGQNLPFTVVHTMMRIDLPVVLKPKTSYSFQIKWWYNINDRDKVGGRSGMEYFPAENNYLYTLAHFFPRMAVYNEVTGWQHKQFLGRGEFTLPFGDYKVKITVPDDHVVGATGVLQNGDKVLTAAQRERLNKAKTADAPVMIVTEAEAREAEKGKAKGKKTWEYFAQNVRDFAFSSSRKFIWDAMPVKFGDRTVMAMSLYPKEGNPLWEKYSTKVIAHTLKIYSKYTIDYPYPVAYSVHTKDIGMEYPMMAFNGGRPEADGTYSDRTKYGMISVIIHEVGHNFFPMIINSDERQWTWMDEGLNTFVQYLAEMEWDLNYPSRRGPAYKIVDYMKGDKSQISPIMANSESVYQFGNNAYGKPATALNILRETVMGRELFDFAFKEYCRRWAFRHPSPADFFRTMEDASAIDLDWFWRGWFYSTEHVDLSLDNVKWMRINTGDPQKEAAITRAQRDAAPDFIGDTRNKTAIPKPLIDQDTTLRDFYNRFDPLAATAQQEEDYKTYVGRLSDDERKLLNSGLNYYELTLSNVGGLPMPVILEFQFADGSKVVERIPAEIWKMDQKTVSKVFFYPKEVTAVHLDPFLETADVDFNNNNWPPVMQPSRFQLYKNREQVEQNPMRQNGLGR